MMSLEDMQRRRLESMRRYMVPGERILIATHDHWIKLAEPVGTATAGLVLVAWLDTNLGRADSLLTNVLWWAWFALVARMLWVFLDRQHTWFVSTDRRLLLTFGLVNQKVAMMPMAKVTDMSYNRSILGRLCGYGTFVLESAGQEQALREITLIPRPDYIYRTICAVMFGSTDNEDELAGTYDGDEDVDGSAQPASAQSSGRRGGDAGARSAGQRRQSQGQGEGQGEGPGQAGGRGDGRSQSGTGQAAPGERSANGGDDGDGEAERRRTLREADTGPIPVQRPRRRR